MEDQLRKLQMQSPPSGLRERVLAAARAELARTAARRDWADRLWASRAFWYSTAAAVLICLTAAFLEPGGTAAPPLAARPADPRTTALAKELARTLGDGPALEQRFVAQLSGPTAAGGRTISREELLRSIQ